MKKTFKFIALVFALVLGITTVSCKKIIDGNVITDISITLDFYGEDGTVTDTQVVKAQLYNNNSPKTVKHVKALIKSGYYNGTNVSLVGSDLEKGFAQFGGYYYDKDGVLTQKEYTGKTVEGEFKNNGWDNQKLSASSGSIVLKHNFYSVDGENEYDTGKATLMFMLGGLSEIDKENFCVIGKVLTTDGDATATSTSEDVEVDRSTLSSFAIVDSIRDFKSKSENEGTTKSTLYFNEKTQDYVLRVVVTAEGEDSESTTTYYMGTDTTAEVMDEDSAQDFEKLITSINTHEVEFYDWQILPYRMVVVRNIKIK